MPQLGTIYRALVASPGDCIEERKLVPGVFHRWNTAHSLARSACVLPVLWEVDAYPQLGDRPQGVINSQLIDHCDLLGLTP